MLVRAVAAAQPPPPPLGSTIAARLRALDPQAAYVIIAALKLYRFSSHVLSDTAPAS